MDGAESRSLDSSPSVANCADAVQFFIESVATRGDCVGGVLGSSVGHHRSTRELLNVSVSVVDPRQRHAPTGHLTFRMINAVARVVWMLAANDRVEDIAFYDPGVRQFTDNGVTIPGSSFGHRLFEPQPGVDQIRSVIERLRADPHSRRAMATVYTPYDSIRESRDIPCLALLAYHIRNDSLRTTVVMRSNNIYRLLPYNLFELSFLSEMIACELDVELGELTHHCISAHIYEDEYEAALCANSPKNEPPRTWIAMPRSVSPFEQAKILCSLEAKLRTQIFDYAGLKKFFDSAATLDPYWRSLLLTLVPHIIRVRNISNGLSLLKDFGCGGRLWEPPTNDCES